MKQEEALELVKPQLTEKRYQHTLGVLRTALKLARRFGASEKKAELAAIFHDYAKYRNIEEMKQLIERIWYDRSIVEYGDELLHAPCGAYYVEKEIGIRDEEILDAIRYHTTGRPKMTLLDKIIFIADYIEPSRQFEGVEKVRDLAENDLDEAIIHALENTIAFLMRKKLPIYPLTVETYNEFVKNRK